MREKPNRESLDYAGFWVRAGATFIDTVLFLCITYPLTRLFYNDVEAALVLEAEIEADIANLDPVLDNLISEGASTWEIWLAVLSNMSWVPPVIGPADFFINWVFPFVAIMLFWIFRGATPGKMVMRARIVDAKTGDSPGAFKFVVRYIGYFVSSLPLCLGFLWVAFDKQKRGWHDLMAGTIVVKVPKKAAQSAEGAL